MSRNFFAGGGSCLQFVKKNAVSAKCNKTMPVLCLCYRKCPYVSQACTEMFMDEMVMKSESCKVTQGKCSGYR